MQPAVTVTGAPAVLIILLVLVILIVGAFVLVRAAGRGARRMTRGSDDDGTP